MMIYEYFCEMCEKAIEKECSMGEAPKTVKCECGKRAARSFGGCNFAFKGGGWPSKFYRFNKEMTDRNRKAGERMRGTWEGTQPKLIDQR